MGLDDVVSTPGVVGAVVRSGATHFSVWAPERKSVDVGFGDGSRVAMTLADNGYWSASVEGVAAGARYGFALDDSDRVLADPVSRFQPDGPEGLSEVIDATQFPWTDAAWSGKGLAGAVLYELHIGTFTSEGTWDAARCRLPHLAELGVTLVEVMPIAEFAGRFGWGYDGVNLYSPFHAYGRPDDLRRFIDAAHAIGIGVILDVVYNHVGPVGNYLTEFCPRYFSDRATEWGQALNYDGEDSRHVREFIARNAEYWVRDFHFDGFRLDATQSIFDESDEHIISELGRRARVAAGKRTLVLIAENEPQDTNLLRPIAQGGCGLDAVWNDDFHHSATVALLGLREAYYTDYLGRAQELVAAMKFGYLYQGQHYAWQKKRRGAPGLDLEPRRFVAFLENHDQVANSARGERLRFRAHPAQLRAMTATLLLGPWTPMLFQGQELASQQRFNYFADFKGELAEAVVRGRRESLSQFPSFASRAIREALPTPHDVATFEQSKLDWNELDALRSQQALALHRDLLRFRRDDRTLADCIFASERRFETAVLTDAAFLLRYFGQQGDDRLLVVNLGRDLIYAPAPEPLLAPPKGADWLLSWTSEDPRYGGDGVPDGTSDQQGWRFPAFSAVLFEPSPAEVAASSAKDGA